MVEGKPIQMVWFPPDSEEAAEVEALIAAWTGIFKRREMFPPGHPDMVRVEEIERRLDEILNNKD